MVLCWFLCVTCHCLYSPAWKQMNLCQCLYTVCFNSLLSVQIAASVAQEMRRMQRRRQLHYPSSTHSASMSSTPATSTPEKAEYVPSCSTPPDHSPQMSQSLTNLLSSMPHIKKDVPLFTFRQVSLICERLVRDREEAVVEQYDKVLNCKLAGSGGLVCFCLDLNKSKFTWIR